MSPQNSSTLMIAGGGTGGHVLAGVAVADAWRAQVGVGGKVIFVGARGGIEEKLVPRAGYSLKLLRLGSLNRVSLWRRLKTFFLLPISLLKSLYLLFRFRPDAVLGVGGYASGPLVLMARILSSLFLIRTKTAILEQNSIPGMTNRMLGRFAQRIFCAFPGTEAQFSAAKVELTGNPIRSAMRPLPPANRRPFTVFVFGGSQGAQGINSLVLEALPLFSDIKEQLRFIHQTGEKDYERVLEGHRRAGMNSRVERFVFDMPEAYAEASLLICRAGSSTLSEVAAVGRAAVLIPFPFASDNHQEKNARIFSDIQAAFLLSQVSSNGLDLARIIRKSFLDAKMIGEMEKAVTRFYRPNAAQDIVRSLRSSL